MSDYVLSEAADADLDKIATDSVRNWGFARAARYLLDLHKAFETLSDFPNIGKDVGYLRDGYFWFAHGWHSIFYKKTGDGIYVVRVLHQKQIPENYL